MGLGFWDQDVMMIRQCEILVHLNSFSLVR